LNRFDEILASANEKYGLNNGPQTKPFSRHVLVDSYASDENKQKLEDMDAKLTALGYGVEGDRELLEAILDFSRLLLDKCGNRSLYSSSERLGELLNTTSLSLLQSTLRLSLSLAQRYHSRQRGSSHIQQSLLAAHYNIDLEKLQKIAAPFPRPFISNKTPVSPTVGIKGKDKGPQTKHEANVLATLARENDGWDEWGHVHLLYYPSASDQGKSTSEAMHGGLPTQVPTTPTPLRRSSTHPTPRLSRTTVMEDSPSSVVNTPSGTLEEATRGGKVLDISYSKISSSTPESLLASHLEDLPDDSKYELLHRIRTAQGLAVSSSSREQILAIRLLAITNLAYVYPESLFQQKILQYDMEQPKRLQLPYQLGELVHLGASGDLPISRSVQTLALHALDSLAKHKARAIDVCAALSVNVNHGVLMFLTRKAVSELGSEDNERDDGSQDEWRDALLSLLRTLPGSSTRTPETLVSAGLIPMFVDVLNLRTEKARRVYSRIMEFLDTFVHAVRDALGTLTTAKGFDAISDLIDFETKTAFENVARGAGIPSQHKTPSIDYQIPYFQQQTLRWMFRFVNHIMQHNGGGFDRVLRNLIDSPQLLTSLRLVIENARIFGSHVWSNAVNILSSFIHNEPTSYAVIAEAGLSKSFLEAITHSAEKPQERLPVETEGAEVESESTSRPSEVETRPSTSEPQKAREYELARSKDTKLALGIIPSAEALSCIPSAFGAICLNSSGLELFQSSHALESFFEIFENPEHVKCLKDDPNLVRSLGTTFDELVRHHPALKSTIMAAVIVMVARVGLLCRTKAWTDGMGSKLWTDDSQGKPALSGSAYHLFRRVGGARVSADIMPSDLGVREINSGALPDGGTLSIGDISHVLPTPNCDVEPKDADATGLTVTDYLYPVLRFLGAFFENQSNCQYFIESGGVELVLDIATLQSLPFDFHNTDANQELTVLVHMLAETKPHLVVPGLVDRAEQIVEVLSEFWRFSGPRESGFFTPLIKPALEKEPKAQDEKTWELARDNGTYFAKHMVAALILTDLLREVYSMPLYQTRPSQQTSAFAQVNLADRYCSLIGRLGGLHAACVWEEILLEKNIPDTWDQATKVQPAGSGSEKPSESAGSSNLEANLSVSTPQRDGSTTSEPAQPGLAQEPKVSVPNVPESSVAFKNVQALRYLLSSLPSSITGFFHNLGLGLIGKRRIDLYQKQNATMVAEAIASAVLEQLQFEPPNASGNHKLRFAYLIVILSSFSHLLFESKLLVSDRNGPKTDIFESATADRPHSHYLTLVLFAFKRIHGLRTMKDICEVFVREVKSLTPPESVSESENDVSARLTSAYGGIKIILSFFSELSSGKNIVDSSQTQAMTSSDRDRDRPDYFQPGQFLVDLRMEILPMARELWNTDFATQSSSSVIKCLVDILRSSLDGEYETGAARHSEPPPALTEGSRRKLVINRDRVAALQAKDFDLELVKEALYRCNNVYAAAEEYCKAQNWLLPASRIPPPPNDIESVRTSSGEASEDSVVGDAPPLEGGFLERSTLAMLIAQASGRSDDIPRQEQGQGGPVENEVRHGSEFLARALSHILNDDHSTVDSDRDDSSSGNTRNPNQSGGNSSEPSNVAVDASSEQRREQPTRPREVTTVEDLDREREKVRSNLIERCLDVLNEHHDVSFELADLIASATKKHRDPESFRKEVGEILVQSLVSLQMENFQAAGKKVAAYAHLLALVVQDRDMYTATLEELKECFTTFLGFISVPSEKTPDESFPWIGHVLLVLEKLLSDDSQPVQIRWNMPDNENLGAEDEAIAQLEEPLVSHEQKSQLFEALVEILPRIGKDDTLALSVCRILVILTRNRSIATRLGEKRSLQRLFVMVKQLSSSTNEKLQGAFMLILRHIIEDEDTIRQIMRSEIVANFESKSSRQIDTTGFVRQMYHLVLRSPELFVEVSNEKLKLQRYDSRQRPQALTLKSDKNNGTPDKAAAPEGADNAKIGGQTSSGDAQLEDTDKGKGAEMKPPVVENPDGVIHYLLSELLSYKDVDDKEPPTENTDTSAPEQSEIQTDVEMVTDEPSPSVSTTDLPGTRNSKKAEKPPFKADDHPIYIYRCFLLQCLTELLSSYNRTKVEFINFSRKADPLATTPSKPRSGVLNYFLNALVPLGTLEHDESVAFKKRANTSAWTMRVLVASCTKTGEFGGTGRRRSEQNSNEEDEPELAFVRRFVLEHALRAYKEANTSNEPLDAKYSRLMSLADLFDKMLSGYAFVSGDTAFPSSTRQLAKTMFEKNFIAALTASVAEIDLNFPASKRVIKYILRPLNKLTQTAVILSETSGISSIGDTEADEISSATSVSDLEDDREETPDLFRHSTLGMLEPRHEEETSSEEGSEEEDDEMYDDEYEEEMDYEEDLPEDDGEVVSDEEDEIEGVGPIEGLPGDSGMDIEVVIDDDEDEDDENEDDEDDDESDMDDDEILAGEITGDRDNESLEEGDDDEWESEEMSEDDEEAEILNQFEDELAGIRQAGQRDDGQRFDDLFRVLNEAAGGVEDLQADSLGDIHDDIVDDDLNEDDGQYHRD
jgi:E3 ubiquitin-protein ligase HUWE1